MVQEILGVDHIGEQTNQSIFASDFPVKQKPVIAKEDLLRGSVVKKNSDNTVSLVSIGDATTDPDIIYGVLIRDRKAGETGMAWVTGDFIGSQLTFGSGTWQAWDDILRENYAPIIFSEGAN